MKIKHYPEDRLKQDLVNIVGKYLDLKTHKIFFFGSRVLNTGSDRSDIDLGIEGSQPLSPQTLLTIQEEVEKLPTLYTIEIVDLKTVSPQFNQVAKQKIEAIN